MFLMPASKPRFLTLARARVRQSIGFAGAGSGGTVTQATSKATQVTLNKPNGVIILNNALLAASTTASFTLVNSYIAPSDILVFNHQATGTFGAYTFTAQTIGLTGTAIIYVRNVSLAGLSEAIQVAFAIIKATGS